jgi:uncharacterized secreted protein with C-terminal beta-propeller domain
MVNNTLLKKVVLMFLVVFGAFVFSACGQITTKGTNHDLPNVEKVENFSSYDDLKTYLGTLYDETDIGYFRSKNYGIFGGMMEDAVSATLTSSNQDFNNDRDHSETNNQVDGVEEYDTVQTDGYHIYLTTWSHFYILNADTLAVEYDYTLDNGYMTGLFLEGDRVVLLGYQYTYDTTKSGEDYYYYYHYAYGVMITVFNVENVSATVAPTVEKDLFFENSYLSDARMIDEYVYLVMNNYMINYGFEEDAFVPVYRDSSVGNDLITLPAENIYVMPNDNMSINYLLLASFSIEDDEPAQVDGYIGSTYQIYMSLFNLYTVMYRYTYDQVTGFYDYSTYVLRFQIAADRSLVYQAMGIIEGSPLNQFSMDEYQGYFRIATTGYEYTTTVWNVTNSVFVLDATSVEEMTKVGEITGLGKPLEHIYSCRFDGAIGYVVTYYTTDPMYKIDFSDPTQPVIVAELSQEGVSDYLHIMGDDLVLGVGRQSETVDDMTRFVGVKIELYRSQGTELVSIEKYLAEGEYSYTNVAWDHKTFMTYTPQGADFAYVTVPVSEYYNNWSQNSQNLYVFKVYFSGDLELVTKLSHVEDEGNTGYYWYYDSIDRSIIIGSHIYTISNAKIEMFDMADDFAFEVKTELESTYRYFYMID